MYISTIRSSTGLKTVCGYGCGGCGLQVAGHIATSALRETRDFGQQPYISIAIYIYIHIHTHIHTYIYMYMSCHYGTSTVYYITV